MERDEHLQKVMTELREEGGNKESKFSIQQEMLRYKDKTGHLQSIKINSDNITYLSRLGIRGTLRVLKNLQKIGWRIILGRHEARREKVL